jgi:hypothetical protein
MYCIETRYRSTNDPFIHQENKRKMIEMEVECSGSNVSKFPNLDSLASPSPLPPCVVSVSSAASTLF